MKNKITLLLLVAAALCLSVVHGPRRAQAASTLVVDNDKAQCPAATFATSQSAVTAAAPATPSRSAPALTSSRS